MAPWKETSGDGWGGTSGGSWPEGCQVSSKNWQSKGHEVEEEVEEGSAWEVKPTGVWRLNQTWPGKEGNPG